MYKTTNSFIYIQQLFLISHNYICDACYKKKKEIEYMRGGTLNFCSSLSLSRKQKLKLTKNRHDCFYI